MLPPLVSSFLLTLAVSFLIGIGLRDYYEGEGKFDTFGTVRTFVFFGMLGFMLYQIPVIGVHAFLLGMAAIVPFLLVYYNNKVSQKKSPGLIGVLIAILTYTIGPVVVHQPHWFVVLFGVSILFVLHSKGRIRKLTDRLETGDFVLAEAQPTYRVCDLVVYRVPKGQIGAGDDLIHRMFLELDRQLYLLEHDGRPPPFWKRAVK